MKIFFFSILLAFPVLLFSQDCVFEVDNVDCQGSDLSFDLTVTSGGVPHTVTGSYGISFFTAGDQNQSTLFYFAPNTNDVIEDYTITTTLNEGITCDDIIDQELEIAEFPYDNNLGVGCAFSGGTATFSNAPAAIPTMGEWGLIILGLSLVIFGVVVLRRVNTRDIITE
jgi:hypothetical protein